MPALSIPGGAAQDTAVHSSLPDEWKGGRRREERESHGLCCGRVLGSICQPNTYLWNNCSFPLPHGLGILLVRGNSAGTCFLCSSSCVDSDRSYCRRGIPASYIKAAKGGCRIAEQDRAALHQYFVSFTCCWDCELWTLASSFSCIERMSSNTPSLGNKLISPRPSRSPALIRAEPTGDIGHQFLRLCHRAPSSQSVAFLSQPSGCLCLVARGGSTLPHAALGNPSHSLHKDWRITTQRNLRRAVGSVRAGACVQTPTRPRTPTQDRALPAVSYIMGPGPRPAESCLTRDKRLRQSFDGF